MSRLYQDDWIVWNPGGGDEGPDDGRRFKSANAQNAVEQWAHCAESEGWDYMLEEKPETVIVCRVDDICNQRQFRVRAQTSRDYFVNELP
jgi:hypothetical protein